MAEKDIETFQSKLTDDDNSDVNSQFIAIDKYGLTDAYNRVLEQTNPILNHTVTLEKGKYLMTEISSTKVLVTAMPLKRMYKKYQE